MMQSQIVSETYTADSYSRGTSTGPAASTLIATVNAPSTGFYRVTARVMFSGGVPAAPEVDNFSININAIGYASRMVVGSVLNTVYELTVVVQALQGNTIAVAVVGNATAGVVYEAGMVVKKLLAIG